MPGKIYSNRFGLNAKPKDGKDAIYATITKNVGVVECNSSGITTAERTVDAYVAIEKGGTPQTITGIVCKINDSYELGNAYAAEGTPSPATNFKKTATLNNGYVKISIKSGTSLASPVVVVITITGSVDNVSVSRKVTLTIEGKIPGQKGERTPDYEIRSTAESVSIPQGSSWINLDTILTFLKDGEAYDCCYAIFRRLGTSYTYVYGDNETSSIHIFGSAYQASRSGIYLCDAFVIFMADTAIGLSVPTDYLAKKEIPVIIQGNNGATGSSPTDYSLEADPTVINFRTNAAGELPVTTEYVTCRVWRTIGNNKTLLTPDNEDSFDGLYRLYYYDQDAQEWYLATAGTGYLSCSVSSEDAASGLITSVPFALSSAGSGSQVSDANTVKRIDVPVILDGRRGPVGAAGLAPYPVGYYDSTKEYTRDSLRYPMVIVDDGVWNPVLQCNGHYWYLTAATNVVNGVHYAPVDGSPYWAQADDFGIVITMGLFAKFAKLAGAVVSGDYLYSVNGRIGTTEYVNGQTIDGRPAYTRFLGDPTAQKGELSRMDLSGPVANSREVLETVYLAKGTTLTVSVTGKTTLYYFYFYVYKKGGSSVSSYAYLSITERTATISYTAVQDGEYTIECYGSSALAAATFRLQWNVTGMFNPNLWLDLLTGAISGARGNFRLDGSGHVEVNGTVRARNLFKTLALSSGGTQQDSVCTVVIAPDGTPERCICVVKDVPEGEYGHAFTAGQYLTPDEIDALVDEPGAWEYDYEYFVPCTGPADEVLLVPNTVIGASGYRGYVYLPRCQDYAGKEVTVRHTVTSGAATVKQADGASVFVGGPYLSGYTFSYGSNPENYKPVDAGQTAIFYSTGSRWVVLSIC